MLLPLPCSIASWSSCCSICALLLGTLLCMRGSLQLSILAITLSNGALEAMDLQSDLEL